MNCLSLLVFAWNLHKINHITAITTVRLWNELYKEKKIAHDFEVMLAPPKEHNIYMASVNHQEIKAIGRLDKYKNGTHKLNRVAYHPSSPEGALEIIKLLSEEDIQFDWGTLKTQPILYLEGMYSDYYLNGIN